MRDELMVSLASFSGEFRRTVLCAYDYAREKHVGQYRNGGEPYVNHVARVGMACAEYVERERFLECDAFVLVCAGLLHDAIEDTDATYEELRRLFGTDTADIVLAVSHENEEEPEAVCAERVHRGGRLAILLKRFDRIDNIRSLSQADETFRSQKSREIRENLPIWREIDPVGTEIFENMLSGTV